MLGEAYAELVPRRCKYYDGHKPRRAQPTADAKPTAAARKTGADTATGGWARRRRKTMAGANTTTPTEALSCGGGPTRGDHGRPWQQRTLDAIDAIAPSSGTRRLYAQIPRRVTVSCQYHDNNFIAIFPA
ncbi:hypothetical protein PLICRDRAFT_32892 [Plicaturopsis crispa FD-325 SS-3]|uniref:Uncharacterized protein n=1 Tax=Plicaturopsis crispa FD-325 SS-3 TaxID=944288 RepID=A0A0C9T2T1_PLICR|nr:hypothetical protein PLICRDRAFT_32892 [Plicaturopsis crispa FD-325 SS-3]